MGKKKNKKQITGGAPKPTAASGRFIAKEASKNTTKKGRWRKNKKAKGKKVTAVPVTSENKNPINVAGSGKRKAKQSAQENNVKKMKRETQPGQFVRVNQEPVAKTPKEKRQEAKNSKTLAVVWKASLPFEEALAQNTGNESFSDSTDSTYNSQVSSIHSTSSLDDYSEDYDFESHSDDDTYSFSDEEVQEEFSTDTDYTDDGVEEVSEYMSDEDGDYEPGEEYDDVIVRPGEAKYREISSEDVPFEDQSTSQIFEYYSDTNDQTEKENSSGKCDPCKDTSRAVVNVGDVSLDKLPNYKEQNTGRSGVKRKSVTCSKNCSHQQILPMMIKKSKEGSFLASLINDEDTDGNIEAEEIPETPKVPQVSDDEEPVAGVPEANTTVKFYNSIDSFHVLLHLTESVSFHGNLSIKLLAGSASISGYTLDINESVTAHAPVGHSAISIVPNVSDSLQDWKDSISELFFEADFKEIEENLQTSHAILLLNRTSNKRIKMAKKYSANRVFPNMINYKRPRLHAATEYILQCRFSKDIRYNFQHNPDWDVLSVAQTTRMVIAGGKNVGKSTLLRHLVNKNVRKFGKILLIDLDIGQPEIFVPQTISATLLDGPLIGMGCFAERYPAKSYLFGDLNVANDPQKYIECVAKLLKDVEQEYKNVPWLVNTMGYTKGMGLELMIATLKLISPTDVIQINHDIQLENFEKELSKDLVAEWSWNILDCDALALNPCEDFRTFILHTMVSENLAVDIRKSKGPETRQINILAHLGGILGDNCDWLTQAKPIW